jgi:hypothetical protein
LLVLINTTHKLCKIQIDKNAMFIEGVVRNFKVVPVNEFPPLYFIPALLFS